MYLIRQIFESLRFAWKALRENVLRTLLSLLGVTVGIFSIIGVLTMVDTLEDSIRKSLSFLGDKVIYVEKWPWLFGNNYPWWKYVNRPNPTLDEYKFLEKNATWSSAISIYAYRTGHVVKYKTNSISGITLQGVSYGHKNIADIPVAEGRYFTSQEVESGVNVVLIGVKIAEDLFSDRDDVIGKQIKIKGRKFRIVGLLKPQGKNLLNAPSNDNLCILPFNTLKKMYVTGSRRGIMPRIALKGFEDDKGLQELEGEVRGLLRRYRGIRPKNEDSFAINRPEMFATFLETIIGALTGAGWFIGLFALLVGGIGIANIMFVSVKERTRLIGIQKSLGAKNYFILSQFLFEAIFLSLIGGVIGLCLVSLLVLFSTETFTIALTWKNSVLGLIVSSVIGVLSGVLPALMASRLNPVDAIRST